jgi:hypothetical protein
MAYWGFPLPISTVTEASCPESFTSYPVNTGKGPKGPESCALMMEGESPSGPCSPGQQPPPPGLASLGLSLLQSLMNLGKNLTLGPSALWPVISVLCVLMSSPVN